MNALIESIFQDFTVNGTEIPVTFMFYMGQGEPYVVYMQTDADGSISGDDELIGYIDYYDFDVYSKGNFIPIVKAVKQLLTANGFVWQPSRSSQDFYETDTGYYHKTLCFAVPRQEQEEE